MKISIGNDHGPEYKRAIVEMLIAKGYEVTNYGTDSAASVDYPDLDIRWPLMFLKLKQILEL
jgi:ribose 5-phosphate isomerase B